ncbi:MAG: YfhO family protein [Vicinamibacteria bacterium]
MQEKQAERLALYSLVGLVVVLFREPLFGGAVFFKRDVHLAWHPQIRGFVRALTGGGWPLWDPSPAFGQPLLADPGAQVLYPLTWLTLLLDPWTYYTVFAFVHVVFSGLAFYALVRRFPVAPVSAATGAALWVLGGPFLSLVDLWHHFASAAWIPAVFLMTERAIEGRRLRDVAGLGLVLGLQILAGSADVCAMTLLALALWVATLHVPWRAGWRACGPFFAGGALALGLAVALSAGLWLTALDVVSRSSRRDLPESVRTYWSLHPLELAETVAPGVPGSLPLTPAVAEALGRSREPFLTSLYLGLPAVALVAAGLLGAPGRRRFVLAGLGLGALLVALGPHTPFYDVLTALVPPLRLLRYPVKAMILVGFAWAILSALGMEVWRSSAASHRHLRLALVPLAIVGIVSGVAAVVLLTSPQTLRPLLAFGDAPLATLATALRPAGQALGTRAVLALVAVGLAWIAGRRGWSPPLLAGGLAVLAVGDLALVHPRPNPVAPPGIYVYRPDVLAAMGDGAAQRVYSYDYSDAGVAMRRLGRRYAHQVKGVPPGWSAEAATALGMQLSLVPQTAGRWDLRQAYDIDYRGLHSESLARLTHLARLVEDQPGGLLRLLRLGAVTHVVGLHRVGGEALEPVDVIPGLFPDPIWILAVPDPLPRAYAVGGTRTAEGIEEVGVILDPAFSPRDEVLLAKGPARTAPAGFNGSVRIVEEAADRVRLAVELSAEGHVVLVDTHDPGWRAHVDGRPAALLRANVAFRAVAVPAGRHVVEMVYRPPLALAGLVVSGLSLLLIVALLVPWRGPPSRGDSTLTPSKRSKETGEEETGREP